MWIAAVPTLRSRPFDRTITAALFIPSLLGALAVALLFSGTALAGGGHYVIAGGTAYEQQQVRLGLQASSFDWNAVPETITITIQPGVVSESVPGQIWLDSNLLDSGEFSWGVTQDEYAHQVDFYLLNDAQRAELTGVLGAVAWCYGDRPGLTLEQTGCERFASTLAWAYWPDLSNCIKYSNAVASIAPSAFRALLLTMIGPAAAPLEQSVRQFAPVKARPPTSVTKAKK